MGIRQLLILSTMLSLFLVLSCGKSTNKKNVSKPEISNVLVDSSFYFESDIKHAKGFKIEMHEGYKELSVLDPWNKGKIFQKY